MCADVHIPPRRTNVTKMRTHDYIYDSTYIVSGARDYARTAFRAAMESAQAVIQPVYDTMFSALPKYPRIQMVYHANCRLPGHIDTSYSAYISRSVEHANQPTPQLEGRDRFLFGATPKTVLPLKIVSPEFQPPYVINASTKPINRGIQTVYRESSAQTHPWQPHGQMAEGCEETPEVLYLDKLEWGPGDPYRKGDLPADFHTTEIINKMRHARAWNELIEKGDPGKFMKKRDAIICDVETRDWIFRETEIDELQEIRLALLNKLKLSEAQRAATRSTTKLAKLWQHKKQEMVKKIADIHRARDREVRKLEARHTIGGNVGLARNKRICRGGGDMIQACKGAAIMLYAPDMRNGFQARTKHAQITYDLSLLEDEDHSKIQITPPWLETCKNMKKSCSGHHMPAAKYELCERVTKWSEKYLENLHNDLKKARLGTEESTTVILKRRKQAEDQTTKMSPRPDVKQPDEDDDPAIVLQRVIRGRAVQNIMYEGRSRASELIMEVKSTHGLQLEDKERIAKEEKRARNFETTNRNTQNKDKVMSTLVEDLCGSAISSALNFLDKELKRLEEERLQHAFLLIAVRERTMREAAEAGRRQKEERRRQEHDEMFKKVIGITHETVDAYLHDITAKGVAHAAEEDAQFHIKKRADEIDASIAAMSKPEQDAMVCELVHQFLLPEAHKAAAREHIERMQKSKMAAARSSIFATVDKAEKIIDRCAICGKLTMDPTCPCGCTGKLVPVEKPEYREDPRWKHTKSKREDADVEKDISEKFPPYAEFRCLTNTIVDEVVIESRQRKTELTNVYFEISYMLKEKFEILMDCKTSLVRCVSIALEDLPDEGKQHGYHFYMKKEYTDAFDRSLLPECKRTCPRELPSEIRRRAEELDAYDMITICKCNTLTDYQKSIMETLRNNRGTMLPSELRILEDILKCKCDMGPAPTPVSSVSADEDKTADDDEFVSTINTDSEKIEKPSE